MTDPMKEAERLAGFHDAMEDSFSDRIRRPAPMRAKDHAEVAMVLRAVASDLAAARAKIERLTKRAETAEAERDRAMLSCQDVALRLVKAVAERDEARAQVAARAAAAIDAAEAQGATWGQTRLMVRSAILGGDHG